MQTVDKQAFQECIDQLNDTIGTGNVEGVGNTHTAVQGVNVTLHVRSKEYDYNDEEGFLCLVKARYLDNLETIIMAASGEIREIAGTGKSGGLVRVARLLSESFERREEHIDHDYPEEGDYGETQDNP